MTALCVVLLLPTSLIPVLTYVSPMLTGAVVCAVCVLAGKKWAFGVYAAAGILSLLILTDKEAALTFLLFFGYYPIIQSLFEKLKRPLSLALKLLLFNASMIISGLAAVYIFLVPSEEYAELGKFTVPIYLALGNIAFFLYDFSLKKYYPLIKRFVSRVKI